MNHMNGFLAAAIGLDADSIQDLIATADSLRGLPVKMDEIIERLKRLEEFCAARQDPSRYNRPSDG